MVHIVALTFAAAASTATGLGAFRSNEFLSADMRPDMVGRMLAHVEGEWKAQAHVFAECNGKNSGLPICKEAPVAFHKSCAKVVSAIMLGSMGNRVDAKEYMTDVCSQTTISGWKKTSCNFVGQTIVAKMSGNDVENREHYVRHANRACDGLWSHFVLEQSSEEAKLMIASVAADKKEAEAVAEESKKAQAKAQFEKKQEVEEIALSKSQEEADAKASKKRLEDAKNKVTKSFDEQKAKIAATATVEDNIENAFKIAKESKNVLAKKKALAEEAKLVKAKKDADAKDAKNKVTKSFDEQKARVAATVTVEDNIENAFKQHASKESKNVLAKIEAKKKVLAEEAMLVKAKKEAEAKALMKRLADDKKIAKRSAKKSKIINDKVENKIENAFR